QYRRIFLNIAEHFAAKTTQRVPVLLVGDDGAGTDAWVSYLAHLLDAEIVTEDLAALQTHARLDDPCWSQPSSRFRIAYWKHLDRRSKVAGPQVLTKLLDLIKAQSETSVDGAGTLHVVQIGWTKRLRLAPPALRKFIDDLEKLICEASGISPTSCPLNSLGYL